MKIDTQAIHRVTRKHPDAVGSTVPGDKEIGAFLKALGCPNWQEYVSDLQSGNPSATQPLYEFLSALGDPNAARDSNIGVGDTVN